MERVHTEFVVIGAGFSGLAAASRLRDAGRSVTVLEARERVGGRALSVRADDDLVLDLGAQWIGPTQPRIERLVRRHNVATVTTHTAGANLLFEGGHVHRYHGTYPWLGAWGSASLSLAQRRLDALSRTVRLDRPWSSENARALDGETLETYLTRVCASSRARTFLSGVMRTALSCEPGEVSLLHAAYCVHSAGSFERLVSTMHGAQQRRLAGGTQQLAERVASSLGSGTVRTEAPVERIAQSSDDVTVYARGVEARAQRAIIALPPSLARKLVHEPPLPPSRERLASRVAHGGRHKCVAVYDSAFWRSAGLSGHSVCATGPVHATYDASDGGRSHGVLIALSAGSDARTLARVSPAERRARVLDALARAFGERARSPKFFFEKSWSDDPYTHDGVASYFAPGLWTSEGSTLRAPNGRVHWAGTETAHEWNGYLEGALESGERAANEALAAEYP